MTTTFVTSHLVVGDMPTTVSGPVVPVQTPEEAVQVIEHGGTAVLPSGAWETAEDVLRLFGADDEHIRFQVGSSRKPLDGPVPLHP